MSAHSDSSSSDSYQLSYDLFPDILSGLCEFVIPFLKQPPGRDFPQRLLGASPFTFYDQHLDDRLSLKRAILLPSLSCDVAKVVDDRLAEIQRQGYGLYPVHSGHGHDLTSVEYPKMELDYTAERVAQRYASSIGSGCLAIVSSWILHPQLTKYLSTLEFGQRRGPRLGPEGVQDRLSMCFKPVEKQKKKVLSVLDGYTKKMLSDLSGKAIAVWVFLPLTQQSEDILRGMDGLSTLESPACSTRGYDASNQPLPSILVDAKVTPWTLPQEDSYEVTGSEGGSSNAGSIWIASSRNPSDIRQMRTATPTGLAHHAWQVAVEDDATIVVINCGNYERFGIRHRATKTLYLSEMYPCFRRQEEPLFGKIQFGLQLAAMADAIDRYEQRHPKDMSDISQETSSATKKRPGDQLEPQNPRRSKRQKLMTYVQTVVKSIPHYGQNSSIFWKELAKKPVILVRLQYDHFNSPTPSLCYQKGGVLSPHIMGPTRSKRKKSYTLPECALLTLGPAFSHGATGRVHPGQLQISLSDGLKLTHDVVVKVVLEPKSRKRTEREYGVYKHLWTNNVQRIPAIYGLLEDAEDLATLMVMEKGGSSFRDRDSFENNEGLLKEVTAKERATCISIVKDIHRAGVVHRDLRAENILIARDGLPMIIDFDRARIQAHIPDQRREIQCLREILDGRRVIQPLSESPESIDD